MTRYVNGGISKDERNHKVYKIEFLVFSWARTETCKTCYMATPFLYTPTTIP